MGRWHLKASITCALPHKIKYYDFSITSQNTSKWLRRIPPSGKSRIKPKRKTIKELEEEIDWKFCFKIFCHKGVKFFQDNRKMLEGCNTCMKDLNFLSCVMCPLSQPVYLTVQNNDLTVNTFWDNLQKYHLRWGKRDSSNVWSITSADLGFKVTGSSFVWPPPILQSTVCILGQGFHVQNTYMIGNV